MMSRRSSLVLLLVVLVAWWAWPSERARIRSTLNRLAEAVTVPQAEAPLTSVGRLATLRAVLAPDVQIALSEELELDGRDAVLGVAAKLAPLMAPLEVSIDGADITVEGNVAHARVVVRVVTGARDAQRYDGEELSIDLVKPSSEWVVSRVAVDRALSKPSPM